MSCDCFSRSGTETYQNSKCAESSLGQGEVSMRQRISCNYRHIAFGLALVLTLGAATTSQAQNLIVGEYFNRQAIEFSANGSRVGAFAASNGVSRFSGMAFDSAGSLYVAGVQTHNVRSFCTTGVEVGNFITTDLNNPIDVAFDPQGDLYIACAGDSAIRRYAPTGESRGIFAIVPGLDSLTFNAEGYLFVTSFTTNSVRRIAPNGQNLGVFAAVKQPTGLAFDLAGNLYVASNSTSTVRRFSPTGASLGVFASGTGIRDPRGIAVDSAGYLYVANYGSGSGTTVRRFSPTGADLGNFATGLRAPIDITLRPAPLPPIAFSGNITLQESRLFPDVSLTVIFRPYNGCPIINKTVTPDRNGDFTIPNLPRALYRVSVQGAKWLRQTQWTDATSGDVIKTAFYLFAGDANGDNAVDGLDLNLLFQAFDTVPGDAFWNPFADFNCDNSCDVLDLDLLIRNFAMQGDD
jgi:sugar lactone lactonase YvrE